MVLASMQNVASYASCGIIGISIATVRPIPKLSSYSYLSTPLNSLMKNAKSPNSIIAKLEVMMLGKYTKNYFFLSNAFWPSGLNKRNEILSVIISISHTM